MKKEEKREPVRVLRNNEGTAIGVVVETLDEKFGIALEPINGGEEYTWDEAMIEITNNGGRTICNEKQCKIIAVYCEKINSILQKVGGKPTVWEWTCSEGTIKNAWLYFSALGYMCLYKKDGKAQVRPLIPTEIIDKFDK